MCWEFVSFPSLNAEMTRTLQERLLRKEELDIVKVGSTIQAVSEFCDNK